ncbi:MAG: Gfo/Idh/MocA family oxidoreductase [Gemmataceae bacterium]|nr:Gfo/Idh/MocA family oxidoreductase [Gemmataceae bacterium]
MGVNAPLNRKLRMGLVGGGQGSFIGKVHSIAACLDNRAYVAAGALSSDPARAKASAPDYDIPADRAYGSFTEMLAAEAKRPDRIDFVAITTPNHVHYPVAKAALEAGFHVVCDKPMTFDLAEAEKLVELAQKSSVVFALTHNYTGNPLVRQARDMVAGGELGEVQAVRASYIQGWLRTRLETGDQKQAAWRTDPARSGLAGCWGDIGTHAYNLARFITGLLPDQVSAHLKTFEAGRALDDYGTAVVKFANGCLGTVTASQISHGRENDVRIEIDGTKASLEWHQENPNVLWVRKNGSPHQTYTRAGGPYLSATAAGSCRIPSGHPEGYLEAFANIYTAAFDDMARRLSGDKSPGKSGLYPTVVDGLDGMNFITQCVTSSKEGGAWRSLKHPLLK